MRGVFIHDYDSENFMRYVSHEAREGVYRVVYIEKDFRNRLEDRRPIELIVSESSTPAKSSQHYPFDAPRGMNIPRTFLECPRPFGRSVLEEGYDIHREFAKQLHHASLYGANLDGGTLFHKYTAASKADVTVLQARIIKLEKRQSILFQAVEKILKRLHWIK